MRLLTLWGGFEVPSVESISAMGDIKITLETLYDILRNEKKREDLQKLESTFFLDVVEYVREKQALMDSRKEDDEIFAVGERDKLQYELRSIRRILKEIYEKREKKVIDIALNRSHTGSDIIDTSAMLWEEKEFYLRILVQLDGFRQGILLNLFKGELPTILENKKEFLIPPPASPTEPKSGTTLTRIRFIHPLPSFIWKDMKVYGPFDIGQETEIFPEVADLIVRKGRAVKV